MFYFHRIFIIYLILFYLNDSVGFMKEPQFLHDFYVMRPLFWLSAIAQEATKVLQGGVSIPFTGSLRAKGVHFKDHNKNPFAYCLHKLGPIRTSDKSVLIRHNDWQNLSIKSHRQCGRNFTTRQNFAAPSKLQTFRRPASGARQCATKEVKITTFVLIRTECQIMRCLKLQHKIINQSINQF